MRAATFRWKSCHRVDCGRVRKCACCVGHFFDTSEKGTHRWCSMGLCGNRLKVAAYAVADAARARNDQMTAESVTSFLTGNQICREADRATLLTDRTRIRQTAENGETREVREPPHMTLRLLSTTINAFFVVLFLLSGQVHAASPSNPHFKAVAFDYFVILDPDSVVPEVEKAFPSKGVEFTRDLAQ